MNTKFAKNVSNKMLLNAGKCQDSSFTASELLMENYTHTHTHTLAFIRNKFIEHQHFQVYGKSLASALFQKL